MSNAVMPSLPGLAFPFKRAPMMNSKVQEAVSGKETALAYWLYPRWLYSASYDVLRDTVTLNELKTMQAFYLARQGAYDSFLFNDPDDNTITGQAIGTGDGVTTAFQLLRTISGGSFSFTEPMQSINGTPVLKLAGTPTVLFTGPSATGVVTFNTAPSAAVAITADFSYYFRCRFTDNNLDFSKFLQARWSLQKLEFKTVKL